MVWFGIELFFKDDNPWILCFFKKCMASMQILTFGVFRSIHQYFIFVDYIFHP